jgi:hypothetical protein
LFVTLAVCIGAGLLRLSAQEPEGIPETQPPAADIQSRAIDPNMDFPIPNVAVPTVAPEEKGPLAAQPPAESQFGNILFEDLPPQPIQTGSVLVPSLPDGAQQPAEVERRPEAPAESPLPVTGAAPANPYLSAVTTPVTARAEGEAVIDLLEVFRGSQYFQRESERLKADLEVVAQQIAQAREQAQQLILGATEANKEEIDRQVADIAAQIEDMSSKAQQAMKQAEGEIYLSTYRRVRGVIAEYAREHNIHTVRRISAPVTEEEMTAEAVLEWINRDIVYSADEPLDITSDIIERMNATDAEEHPQTNGLPDGPMSHPASVTPPAYGPPSPDEADDAAPPIPVGSRR